MTGRVLVYVLVALFALAVAVSIGTIAALMLRGEPRSSADEKSPPSEEQGNAQQKEKQGNAQHNEEQSSTPQSKADYERKVGELQSESVKAFLDSHDKLLHYDALTADDVERMQTNQAALRGVTDQIGELDPPQKYGEQYEVFRSAIDEMHKATQLAYAVASDPISATQSDFEEYDRHTNEAAARLQRSNEILGRNFATLRGAQRIGPP